MQEELLAGILCRGFYGREVEQDATDCTLCRLFRRWEDVNTGIRGRHGLRVCRMPRRSAARSNGSPVRYLIAADRSRQSRAWLSLSRAILALLCCDPPTPPCISNRPREPCSAPHPLERLGYDRFGRCAVGESEDSSLKVGQSVFYAAGHTMSSGRDWVAWRSSTGKLNTPTFGRTARCPFHKTALAAKPN